MDGRLVERTSIWKYYGSEKFKVRTVKGGTFEIDLDWGVPLKIRLARNDEIKVSGIPLKTEVAEQPLSLTDANVVVIPFKYGVEGQAVDEAGNPVPGAVIDVFDDHQNPAGSVAAGPDGYFIVGTPDSGSYYVAPHTDGGESVTRQLVPVGSIAPGGEGRDPLRALRPNGDARCRAATAAMAPRWRRRRWPQGSQGGNHRPCRVSGADRGSQHHRGSGTRCGRRVRRR